MSETLHQPSLPSKKDYWIELISLVVPDFEPISRSTGKELYGRISDEASFRDWGESGMQSQARSEFVEHVLPSLPKDNPYAVIWHMAQALRVGYEQVLEKHQAFDLTGVETVPIAVLTEAVKDTCCVADLVEEAVLQASDLGIGGVVDDLPMGAMRHKFGNRLSLVKMNIPEEDAEEEEVEKFVKLTEFYFSYLFGGSFEEHVDWMEQVAVNQEDISGYSSLNSAVELQFKKKLRLITQDKASLVAAFIEGEYTVMQRLHLAEVMNVVENLIFNALDHSGRMPEELEIYLWTGLDESGVSKIVVADNGVGFDEEMLLPDEEYGQRAFRPGVSKKGGGTGLAQVYEWAVKRMGGRVRVERTPECFEETLGVRSLLIMEIPVR